MIALLAWVLALAQLALALPFLVELGAGLWPRRERAPAAAGPLPRVAVLMPAHDEARALPAILAALWPVLPPDAHLLVVADNCTDDTAAIARAAGATIVERHDPARRGKGYALAYGRERLHADPPDVVVVLDADCRAEPGALARLAAAAHHGGLPVQGLYLLTPQPTAPTMVQVSGLAFMVKNRLRQRGLARMGAPVPLGGTGMALPWGLFRDAHLGGGHLVEDLALAVALTRAGHPPRFQEDAIVWSDPAGADATLAQRARWEGGYLRVARTHGPRLLAAGLAGGRPGLLWLGLHVLTPPLALLMLGEIAAAGVAIALGTLGALGGATGIWHATALSVAVPAMLGLAVGSAWIGYGRRWLSWRAALALPRYLLWKLPGYRRLVAGRGPDAWVRTSREG